MFPWRERSPWGSASKEVAKQRLRLVLVQDRAGCSPELLSALRQELLAVISKYLEVEEEGVEIRLSTGERQVVLAANVPVRGIRRLSVPVTW